jgi:hypothetical protein
MPEQARLRVHGQGKVEVELVTAYLADLEHAYDALSVFISEAVELKAWRRGFPF